MSGPPPSHELRVRKKRDSAPSPTLLIKGTGTTQLVHQSQLPAFKLSPDAHRTLSDFLSSLPSLSALPSSSPAVPLSCVAAPLSALLTASFLQAQVDCVQQVYALCYAYHLLDTNASTLSSASRKVVALSLPHSSSLPPLSAEQAADTRAALCRPLLSLLLHPIKYPRLFLPPLLSLLSALSTAALLSAVFSPFVSSLSSPSPSQLAVVELGLEWPPWVEWARTSVEPFVRWLTRLLHSTVQLHEERHRGRRSGEAEDRAAVDAAEMPTVEEGKVEEVTEDGEEDGGGADSDREVVFFLRVFVLFLLKQKAGVYSALCTRPPSPLLSSLLHSLVRLLQSPVVGKDPLTQSALAVLFFVHCADGSDEERLAVLRCLVIDPTRASSSPAVDLHPVFSAFATLQLSEAVPFDWFHRCSPIGRLAVYRAILTQSPPELLLRPLPFTLPALPSEASSLSALPSPPTLYFHVLLPAFLSSCHSPSPQLRYYAFQVLNVWFLHASDLVSALPSPSLTAAFHAAFVPLLHLMELNWEHPYRVIIGINKRLFLHYIDLLTLLSRPATPSFDALIQPLIHSVLSHHDRGAYHMLHTLLPHVNAVDFLAQSPQLLPHVLNAAKYQPIWGLALALLQRALGQAWDELSEDTGGEGAVKGKQKGKEVKKEGRAARKERRQRRIEGDLVGGDSAHKGEAVGVQWRSLWMEAVVAKLLDDDEQVRQTVSTTLILFCCKLDPHALPALILHIQGLPLSTPTFYRLRALMSVLTTGRRAGLISSHQLHSSLTAADSESASSSPPSSPAGLQLPITRGVLLQCLLHADVDLRLEAFEFLCTNLYLSELPSMSELDLLRLSFPFQVKISEPSDRSKFLKQGWQRLLVRIRDSVGKLLKQGWKEPVPSPPPPHIFVFDERATRELSEDVRRLLSPSLAFLRWLCGFLFLCQYPASTYERHCAGLEVFRVILTVFHIQPTVDVATAQLDVHLWFDCILRPVCTASAVSTLMASIGRAWQTVRWLSYFILLSSYPAPLPGFSTFPAVHGLLTWALTLSGSPRSRDSEAGALALKLLFKKYVQQLHWVIPIHLTVDLLTADPSSSPPSFYFAQWSVAPSSHAAVFSFLSSIRTLLRSQLLVLQRTPLAYRYSLGHGRLHGIVLLFRLIVEEVQWEGWDADAAQARQWEEFVQEMLSLLTDICLVSLKLHIPSNAFKVIQTALRAEKLRSSGGQVASDTDPTLLSAELPSEFPVDGDLDEEDGEIDGVDCRGHVSLRGSELEGLSQHLIVVSSWLAIKEVALALGRWVQVAPIHLTPAKEGPRSLFTAEQLNGIGGLFLSILGYSKHNGVLENAHAGLLQVCERLLTSSDVTYDLVQGWLDRLLAALDNPVDDSWLRRSRGSAFALLAMLQAQPLHRPPLFLSQAMRQLLRMASSTSAASPSSWKRAVHGLNLLRALYRDASLHVECLPYVSEALTVSVQGFSDPVWAVRNSALISFVPIALKAIRAQYNSQLDEQSGMTAVEFFSHYPTLLPFLSQQLVVASTVAGEGGMHPKLYPLLLLLSKLRPSSVDEDSEAASSFLTSLHSIASHPHAHARRMAAQAFLAMTPIPRREQTLHSILQLLPLSPPISSSSLDYNAIDGRLLQLTELFPTWVSHMSADPKVKEAAVLRFADALLQRRWMGSSRMCIPTLRMAYVTLLSSAVQSVKTATLLDVPDLLSTLLPLAAGCCEPSSGAEFPGIGFALMRKRAAAVLLQSLLSAPLQRAEWWEPATAVSLQLFSDEDDGVKDSALRVFDFALRNNSQAVLARMDVLKVRDGLLRALLLPNTSPASLSHAPTKALVLQVVLQLEKGSSRHTTPPLTPSTLPLDDEKVWAMLRLTVRSEDVALKAAALSCMGRSLRLGLTNLSASSETFQQRSGEWVEQLFELSTDLQVPELRHACWASISQSTLTKRHQRLTGDHVTDVAFLVWRVLMRLMTDESEVIRADAAALAYDSISPQLRSLISLPSQSVLPGDRANGHGDTDGAAAEANESLLQASSRVSLASVTCVTHVVEAAFIHLATAFPSTRPTLSFFLSHFGAFPAYVIPMARIWHAVEATESVPSTGNDVPLFPSTTASAPLSSSPSSTPDSQALNLFSVERLNFVVEDAQLMEMSAWALSASLPRWLPTSSDASLLQRWTSQQLTCCLHCLRGLREEAVYRDGPEGGLRPVGGWTWDETTFLHVYACTLLTTALVEASRVSGLWSAQAENAEGAEVTKQTIALLEEGSADEESPQRLLHPLLRSALQQLLAVLESDAGDLHCVSTFGRVSAMALNALSSL